MAEPDIFDRIRASCAAVAGAATHVHIVGEAIPALADELVAEPPGRDDPGQARLGDDETTAGFVLALDAVNFGSGYFPHLRKRPGHSGYHTVAASLRDLVDGTGPLTTARLHAWTAGDAAGAFGQELDGGPVEELMELFATAWRDLAVFVDRVGDGSFVAAIAAAENSAARMVALLDSMPFFHDVHTHPAVGDVLLYKRAQITVQDLAVAFERRGPGQFHDIDRLTMFPDNLVPHVLRVEGVLIFRPELVARIEAEADIAVGSTEEVEIRACGVHAVELLKAELAARGAAINAADLDNLLWNRGRLPRYKAVPRHRSRCVFY